jgi:hypothetical protein
MVYLYSYKMWIAVKVVINLCKEAVRIQCIPILMQTPAVGFLVDFLPFAG